VLPTLNDGPGYIFVGFQIRNAIATTMHT